MVNNYFYANFPTNYMGVNITSLTVSANASNSVLTLNVAGTLNTTFMNIFGIKTMNVASTSQITKQSSGMELVLVLDNTGSMNCSVTNPNASCNGGAGTKIVGLKTAATDLLNILYGGNNTVLNLWVGVVPFSQTVNIGTGYSNWMDTAYDSTLEFGPTMNGSCQKYTGNSATLSGGDDFAATPATGVITFASNPANGKTIVLNGVVWTFVSGAAGNNQTKIGANLSTTLTSLANNLNASNNASIKVATYYATPTLLEITQKIIGTAGNAYTLGSAAIAPLPAAGTAPATITTPTNIGVYSAANTTCTYTLNGNTASAVPFIQMNNWAGCVMARTTANSYDTSDDPPSAGATLFQAYDYPPTPDAGFTEDPWIKVSTSANAPYTTTTTYNYSYNSNYPGYTGPNLFCPQSVQPMVAEETTVLNKINALTAGGAMLIDIGMAWGQRMLSPRWAGLWGGSPDDPCAGIAGCSRTHRTCHFPRSARLPGPFQRHGRRDPGRHCRRSSQRHAHLQCHAPARSSGARNPRHGADQRQSLLRADLRRDSYRAGNRPPVVESQGPRARHSRHGCHGCRRNARR